MELISLRAVTRRYVSGALSQTVLCRADIDIAEGSFTAICGPSGSGKSTLLNLIGALDRPDEGTVHVCGAEITAMPQRLLAGFRNEKIGFVFQSFHLLPVLTAAENVAWPLYFRGIARRERMRTAREYLSLVGLAGHADKVPGRLSGGQRQRVAIARALVGTPGIVLADEPTANLDRNTAAEIMKLMANLSRERGVTIVCATHDPLVIGCASQVITLRDGKPGDQAVPLHEGSAGHA